LNQPTQLDLSKLTLLEALDLAVLIEEEARDRYRELADQLAAHHTPEAAAFFLRMARIEELHRTALAERRRASFGTAPSTVSRRQLFDVEAPDYDEARALMSLHQALRASLRSEVKAYEFFDGALPHLTDPAAAELFRELREEELEHQQLVKAELARLSPEDPGNPRDYEDEPNSGD
jgi:rubrerythrin